MPVRSCLDCGEHFLPGDPSRCTDCATRTTRTRDRAHAARRAAAPGDGARRRLRTAVNKAGGAVCALCSGWHAAAAIEIDHQVRLADGGHDVDSNVRPLCLGCHDRKTRRGG